MWSRGKLKERAKASFMRNYWMVVLVSAILLVLGGGENSVKFGPSFSTNFNLDLGEQEDLSDDISDVGDDDPLYMIQGDSGGLETAGTIVAGVALIFAIIAGFIVVAGFVFKVLVANPFSVGGKRFFFKNLTENASIKELIIVFKGHYGNVVKTLFLRDLYTILWTLLFVIPGIVKRYEYRMMPYLLAENPDMPKEQAFELSKKMMDGQKWDAFVLDLSFIGWEILSAFSFGILGIFYVNPYRNMTNAALYEALCYQGRRIDTTDNNENV